MVHNIQTIYDLYPHNYPRIHDKINRYVSNITGLDTNCAPTLRPTMYCDVSISPVLIGPPPSLPQLPPPTKTSPPLHRSACWRNAYVTDMRITSWRVADIPIYFVMGLCLNSWLTEHFTRSFFGLKS